MAEKKKYNSILISGRKDQTLTYSKYVKDEESGESVKESLDKKVNVTDELTTQQIKDGAITNEKMAADSVGNTNLKDGSVSNEKLEDGSITNEKLAENSITKDKLQDKTIGVEKLDNELLQAIAAATGLPENLVKTIQNVDETLKDHQRQLDDKQSQIEDKQQQITANDEDISLLQTRSTQMEETIKSIAATGGASQATAVTYNNEKSKLTAVNIQSAVDEVVDKTSIKDEEGALVETPFRYIQNKEYIFANVDAEDKLLFGIQWDGTPVFGKTSAVEDNLQSQVNLLADKIRNILGDDNTTSAIDTLKELKDFFAGIDNTQTLTSILANLDKTTIKDEEGNVQDTPFRVIKSPEYLAIETDKDDKVLAATYPDGSHYAYNMKSETISTLENIVSKITNDTKSLNDNVQKISQKIETISREDVYSRNINNIPLLQSACRYNNGKKDFLMCIITDSHSEEQAVQNAVALTNKIDAIDAIIHCGDITATRFDKTQILNFYNDYKHCEKPWLVVIGNHDVGNTMYLQYSATHEEIFQYYIKPMIDGGILNNGEYQEGKPYYFHDFTDRKIRVIVPYEYDNPLDVADNEYWDSIDYDGSLPQLVPGKTYSVGDKVNSGGYKDNSFICKKEVVTINNQYDNKYTIPYYKSGRTARVIRKEQAEWLVNTLKSTPDEYGVIIATHNPAMINSTNQINSKFAVDTAYKAITQGQYAMETDLISEIVNAFTKKTQLSLKVVMKSANWNKADASYMNILGDTGEKYAYQIEADFSHIQNCYFTCYVGGHAHKDLVFKHDTYESQYGINPVCAITESANRGSADIINTNVDSLNYDALTCISVAKGRIALSRLGNQLSVNGKHRDIEIINI